MGALCQPPRTPPPPPYNRDHALQPGRRAGAGLRGPRHLSPVGSRPGPRARLPRRPSPPVEPIPRTSAPLAPPSPPGLSRVWAGRMAF